MPSSPNYAKVCIRCGTSYIAKKKAGRFCSKSCGAKFRHENTTETVTCSHCNKVVLKRSHNQITCGSKECYMKAQVIRSYKYMDGNKDAYISHLLAKKERRGLSLEYINRLYEEQNGLCAISGVEMTFIKIPNSKKVHTNLSIDRIDSTLPYQEGNIQLVCAITNVMKTTLTMCELVEWCNLIVNCQKG